MGTYDDYPLELCEASPGTWIEMLNYDSVYMPVTIMGRPVEDDGVHLPIVDLKTGRVFWMSKRKPCRVVGQMLQSTPAPCPRSSVDRAPD